MRLKLHGNVITHHIVTGSEVFEQTLLKENGYACNDITDFDMCSHHIKRHCKRICSLLLCSKQRHTS